MLTSVFIVNETISFFKNELTDVLSKLVLAAVILFFGFILGRLIGKLVLKVLQELEINLFFTKILKLPLDELLSNLVAFLIYFSSIFYALLILGLNLYVFNILAIGVIIIIITLILISFREFIPNFIAGIMLHQRRIIRTGDLIELKNIKGKVVHLGLIDTKLITRERDIIFIHNSMILKEEHIRIKRLKNYQEPPVRDWQNVAKSRHN